jgi:hypothetical protein
MQFHHGLFELALHQQGDDVQALVQRLVDQRLFFLARPMQHEVGHRLLQPQRARMADAQAQAPVILGAQGSGDVLQAVVPAGGTAFLDLGRARRQVQFVMHHQHFIRIDLVEARQCADRLAERFM